MSNTCEIYVNHKYGNLLVHFLSLGMSLYTLRKYPNTRERAPLFMGDQRKGAISYLIFKKGKLSWMT